jgi:hypothetical protein
MGDVCNVHGRVRGSRLKLRQLGARTPDADADADADPADEGESVRAAAALRRSATRDADAGVKHTVHTDGLHLAGPPSAHCGCARGQTGRVALIEEWSMATSHAICLEGLLACGGDGGRGTRAWTCGQKGG